jgi:hypothetical protein
MSGNYFRSMGLPVSWVSKNMAISPEGLGNKNDYADECQHQFTRQIDRSSYGSTNFAPTQKDELLVSPKRRPDFQRNTRSW